MHNLANWFFKQSPEAKSQGIFPPMFGEVQNKFKWQEKSCEGCFLNKEAVPVNSANTNICPSLWKI